MRTLIEGGWVVAFNGTSHEVYEQGSVVFEDDRIVHAGGPYAGAADVRLSARGKLVSPGFINTHVHTAGNGADYLLLDMAKNEQMRSILQPLITLAQESNAAIVPVYHTGKARQGALGSVCFTQIAPGTPPMMLGDGMAKRIPAGWKILFVLPHNPITTLDAAMTALLHRHAFGAARVGSGVRRNRIYVK